MKTKKTIHPEWLGQTESKFYAYKMAGYVIHIEVDGSWQGERKDDVQP